MNRTLQIALSALLLFVAALFLLWMQWLQLSHVLHPVALAGARGVPGAMLFNALVFVLPGVLVMLVALRLRGVLPVDARWPARIGAGLLLLSAIAFSAQGLLPLDPEGLDDGASRFHASAWMAWWIAFALGAPLFALAAGMQRIAGVLAALAVLTLSLFASDWVPAGAGQRAAYVVWFSWFWRIGSSNALFGQSAG